MCKLKWFCYVVLMGFIGCARSKIEIITNNNVTLEVCPPSQDVTKRCNLREYSYSRKYWNYVSGYFCLYYTDPNNYYNDSFVVYNTPAVCSSISNEPFRMNSLYTHGKYIFFDYSNKTSMKIMKKIFKTQTAFELYLICGQEADECCNNTNDTNVNYTPDYCPIIFDSWECYPRTKVDTIVKKVCSPQTKPTCRAYSEKTCFFNETSQLAQWVQKTNYIPCTMATIYERRHKFNVITLLVAIFLTFPSIVILFFFSKLRKQLRLVLHRNLLIAIVIRNILTIIVKETVLIHETNSKNNSGAMEQNSVGCRVLAFFENVFKNAMYSSMLVDGFYLHKIIARPFGTEPKVIYLYATVISLSVSPSLIWAVVKGTRNRPYCWLVDYDHEQWIVDSFRILVLTVNIFLLLDIIRVMFVKMKQGKINDKARAAFKATVFLIPLFGIHFLITAHKGIVWDDTCLAEDIYDYVRYSLEALQGVMVAALFCYFNAEVHTEIKNLCRKLRLHAEDRFGWQIGRKSTKMRRDTTSTYVPEIRQTVL